MRWEFLRHHEGEKAGWTGEERVAIGAARSGARGAKAGKLVWFDVTNVHPQPEHNFAVHGDQVQEVLIECRRRGLTPHVLWHCHEAQVNPSAGDIAALPHWIHLGLVFDCFTRSNTAFDRTGLISSTNGLPHDVTVGS